ncbi:MAG: biotin/lipoyl-containing protein, partial [Ignavibacteriales bacterium]
MKIDVVMPKMGESVNEGTIIKWHKKKGEKVKKDEIIFEISTDKVDTEIPSPADGILADIKVFEQETVQVDTVVAVIETESSVEEPAPAAAAPPSKPSDTEQPSTTQVGGNIVDIPMPKMGESVMEGTIIKWHKKPGEQVKKDETLFEISTDKVDTEVPSPEQGVLTEILVGEQQTVTVGTIVARITTKSGVAKPQVKSGGPGEIVESPSPLIEESEKEIGTLVESYNEPVVSKSEGQESGRFYSPLVLNIARQENVSFNELDAIRGSGIEGRVTKKDILDYINNRKAAPASRREP